MGQPNSIFGQMIAAKVPYDHHESDLYVKDCPAARQIITAAQKAGAPLTATFFTNQRPPHVGERWIDLPFMYSPFWDSIQAELSIGNYERITI